MLADQTSVAFTTGLGEVTINRCQAERDTSSRVVTSSSIRESAGRTLGQGHCGRVCGDVHGRDEVISKLRSFKKQALFGQTAHSQPTTADRPGRVTRCCHLRLMLPSAGPRTLHSISGSPVLQILDRSTLRKPVE